MSRTGIRMTSTTKKALHIIRTQEVTYTYRPMRRVVNKPEPVTVRELTPVYSHGIKSMSVEALMRHGLVTLSPHSERHGRVLPVETEED